MKINAQFMAGLQLGISRFGTKKDSLDVQRLTNSRVYMGLLSAVTAKNCHRAQAMPMASGKPRDKWAEWVKRSAQMIDDPHPAVAALANKRCLYSANGINRHWICDRQRY